MSSDPKAPEAREWQGGERPEGGEGSEGGDELCSVQAPSVETTATHLVQSHSADRTARSPVGLGFLEKYGKGRRPGSRRTPEPTGEPLMAVRIHRLEQILGRFDPTLTVSQDREHLAFASLPTNILLMAQELVTVKNQLKSGVQIVGRELARVDEQVRLLDLESQKVQESFASQVAKRLGERDERQTRHEAVTSHLHEAVQGTGEQSMRRDLLLDQEIVRINEQHKRELANHEMSINLVRNELRKQQESREAQDSEIAVLKALVEQLMGQVKGRARCQIRYRRFQGRVEEDHHPHDDMEQQELQTEEGEETPMMMEKGLVGSQMREGKEDGTRDPHPSQRKTAKTPKTTNNLTSSHGSWPTLWDNGHESKRNPLPCFEMRNTKISACG